MQKVRIQSSLDITGHHSIHDPYSVNTNRQVYHKAGAIWYTSDLLLLKVTFLDCTKVLVYGLYCQSSATLRDSTRQTEGEYTKHHIGSIDRSEGG